MLILGLVIVLVGISDLVIAAVYARREAAADGGLGGQPSPFVGVLKRTGMITIAVGIVVAVIGLFT